MMSNEPEAFTTDFLEIDLLAWLRTVIRAWKLLVGIMILALLVAGIYTLLQPRLYKATAVLVTGQASAQTSPDPQLVARTALEVALSDRMVSEVYDLVRPHHFQDRNALRRAMEATVGRDPRLVRLTVWSPDPTEAAAIANTWARLVVVRVDDVYLGRPPTPASALGQTNPDLGEAVNPVLLQIQRDAAQADLKALQGAVYGLEGVERDIRALRERVARADGDTFSLEDQLTALFLQLRVFGIGAPERIEFGSDQLGGLTKDRQALLARLDDLIQVVTTRRGEMEARMAARRATVE
uniref:Wzz/FepE/Etk N-terminal domain-containing protein n=1 Tax=Thermoflexus sp. TaxID=1969742 RepID=UPI0035E41F49